MILVEIPDADLLDAIEKKKKGWLKRAERILASARKTGKIGKKDSIWSEIKEVFILLQDFRCIYCEFPLPKVESNSAAKVGIDYDVEHYRPKNRVTPWPAAEDIARRPSLQSYQSSVTSGPPSGYLRLAVDPFNYVVSCKVCNSSYKADRFPIAGKADTRSKKRASLNAKEKPLLLFPFGEEGDDPKDYLGFTGPLIRARGNSKHERLRARVVIDFFELDTREDLFEGRCRLIQELWPQLEQRRSGDPHGKKIAEDYLKAVEKKRGFPHTACGRAYIDLYDLNRPRAQALYNAALIYLPTKDRTVFQPFEG